MYKFRIVFTTWLVLTSESLYWHVLDFMEPK